MPKKKKKTKQNNTKWIILGCSVVVVLLVVIVLVILMSDKKIVCEKELNNTNVTHNSKVVFSVKEDNINKISVDKTIKASNDSLANAIKVSLDEQYGNLNIKYDVKLTNSTVKSKIIYDKKEEYIIDNLIIDGDNNGVSVNFISDDQSGDYAKFNLNNKYTNDDILDLMNKAGYTCN